MHLKQTCLILKNMCQLLVASGYDSGIQTCRKLRPRNIGRGNIFRVWKDKYSWWILKMLFICVLVFARII